MKLHHIGIATANIEDTLFFIETNLEVKQKSEIIFDILQDATLCMLEMTDGRKIELVAGNAVEKFIKKKISVYHICFEVENITKAKEKWVNAGAIVVSDEKEAILFENRKVVFLMTKIGLIELLEK